MGQAYFAVGNSMKKQEVRGWGIYSAEALTEFLSVKRLSKKNVLEKVGEPDFKEGFVFVVENGHLEEIEFGAESVSYAKLRRANSVGTEITIVIGARNRPIKVFGDN